MTYGVDLTYSTYIASSEIIKNDEFLDIVKASAVVFFFQSFKARRKWLAISALGLHGRY